MNNSTIFAIWRKQYCFILPLLFLCLGNAIAQNQPPDCTTNQPPILDCSNLKTSIFCFQDLDRFDPPIVSDDHTPADEISLTFEEDDSNVEPCYAGGNLLRTWTATDACGLTATCVQTIQIANVGLISACNLSKGLIRCEAGSDLRQKLIDWDQGNRNFLLRCTNNSCNNPVTITSTFDANRYPAECISISEIFASYTVRDSCGRVESKRGSVEILKTTDAVCDGIQLQAENNQLIVNDLIRPNTHVKVLDQDYAIIFECIRDCGERLVVPDLNADELYRTHIQVYDASGRLICDNFQEIRMEGGSEPCDTTICQGDVFLRTQAEVDAFCGCEAIEGDLIIGDSGGDNFSETDIINLENLSALKTIGGSLVFGRTQLVNFKDLENITLINNLLSTVFNSKLETYEGLTSLENLGGIIAIQNPALKNFGENNNFKTITGQIYIEKNGVFNSLQALSGITKIGAFEMVGCPSIKNLNGFNEIVQTTGSINIRDNSQLENLSGLEKLKTIGAGLILVDNPKLTSIAELSSLIELERGIVILRNNELISLEGLENVALAEVLNIQDNSSLTDCCSISHLLDDDLGNGNIVGEITISNNPQFCSSVEEILQNCQNATTSTCESIQINTEDNRIILSNLTAPNNIIKIFDKDYNIVYECVANCQEKQQLVGAFPNGAYIVDIQLYDENWENICAEQRSIILEETNPCNTSPCETTPPVLANVPADATYNSFEEIPTEELFNVTATDNCDTDVEITFVEESVAENILTRTFTATDNCGNSASASQTITIVESVRSCDDISLISSDNQLTIRMFSAPNTLVKVFDNNWQLVFQCSENCDETLVFQELQIGDVYHLDAQFYDENWQLICSKKADKRIGSDTEPCPDPICQGDITLATQAEVDAFCGCEVIDGVVNIGNSGEVNDIVDLSNLSGLKEIKGGLVVRKTQLKDLSGLDQLETVSSLSFFDNLDLISFLGLENLTGVEIGLFIRNAPILSDISSLSGLKSVRFINIFNAGIKDLSPFQNLESATINNLIITNCNRLTSLKGIEGINRVIDNNSGTIIIAENEFLTDISALENIELINGALIIRDNFRLSECCPLAHLIDDDLTNGVVQNNIIINNNPFVCGSVAIVLEECQNAMVDKCAAIQIDRQPNQLTINGIDASNPIVKVFNKDYQLIFECIGDCEANILVENLTSDEPYHLDIQLYDRDWVSICNLVETVNPSAEDRTNPLQPIDFSIAPNPAQAEVLVDLNRLAGATVFLQLHNQFGQVLLEKRIEKATKYPEKLDLTKIPNGLYFLQVQAKGKRAVGKKLIINNLY